MEIKSIARPWCKATNQRRNRDPFYQSQTWKQIRDGFKNSAPWIKLPPINGFIYSNKFCADCWERGFMNDEKIEIDHVQAIKDGGSRTDYKNLRSRCHGHHNGKTYNERKLRSKK